MRTDSAKQMTEPFRRIHNLNKDSINTPKYQTINKAKEIYKKIFESMKREKLFKRYLAQARYRTRDLWVTRLSVYHATMQTDKIKLINYQARSQVGGGWGVGGFRGFI